jgi:c-di-GMP-binding flagellar brake protein YcgR
MPAVVKRSHSGSVRVRRKSHRIEAVMSGTIIYGRDRRSMYCVLLDISDDGAKLVPAEMRNCPDRFSLKVAGHPDRDCKVVWRRTTQMGVKFERSQA